MLSALSFEAAHADTPRASTRRLRRVRLKWVRRAGAWLLLTGWIVLPLLPVLALALSKVLGVEF